MTPLAANKHIILFDGDCKLCNYWLSYTIKHDKKDIFQFSPLQSATGKDLLLKHNINNSIDSIVLLQKGKAYKKSTAALRILKSLSNYHSILYIFIIIPPFIRDFIYDIIAKYRYKWFGKASCEINPTEKNKFLM
jgi:predicted DCC family thiol-disulfide oxidoreductase YuxK